MSNSDTKDRTYGFSSPTFSWSSYTTYRPAYPHSLYNLILSHHRLHSNHFDSAHDIGSGAGVVALELSKHFTHLHVSDPSEHNLANARNTLARVNPDECKVSFTQTPAEALVLPEESVDLVTVFEALHWTEHERAVESAYRSLRPGGTLALLHYGPRVFIPNNARAMAAWNRVMDAHSRNIYESQGDLMGGRKGHPRSDLGLDYVALPANEWEEGVKRFYINTDGRGRLPFVKSVTAVEEGWFPLMEKCVIDKDVVEKWQDEEDWGRMVDGEWFRGYFSTIQPTPDMNKLEAEFKELKEALKKEEEGGKTRILWSVAVVLATKRVPMS